MSGIYGCLNLNNENRLSFYPLFKIIDIRFQGDNIIIIMFIIFLLACLYLTVYIP